MIHSPDAASFADSWAAAWRALGLPAPADAVRDDLLRRWSEPQRHYHTLQHLAECLALFERHRKLARHPGEVAIAYVEESGDPWVVGIVYANRFHRGPAVRAAG